MGNEGKSGIVKIEAAGAGWPTGKIRHGFKNDLLFKIIFQKNKRLLRELLCSLL